MLFTAGIVDRSCSLQLKTVNRSYFYSWNCEHMLFTAGYCTQIMLFTAGKCEQIMLFTAGIVDRTCCLQLEIVNKSCFLQLKTEQIVLFTAKIVNWSCCLQLKMEQIRLFTAGIVNRSCCLQLDVVTGSCCLIITAENCEQTMLFAIGIVDRLCCIQLELQQTMLFAAGNWTDHAVYSWKLWQCKKNPQLWCSHLFTRKHMLRQVV